MSMYPGWTAGDETYWSQQTAPKQPYDPLLYNQNYMNNMKNMLAAQWADQPNPYVFASSIQPRENCPPSFVEIGSL